MQNQIFDVGWIGLYRSILRHWIYPKNRPFTKYEAWIDLLLMVNFEDKKIFIGESLIDCNRGEIITSQSKLMSRWKWSKSKLMKFFSVLEIDKMCIVKSDNKKTSIKICNYINYQDFKEVSKNKKTSKKTVDDTTERLQKDTTKEIQERKEVNYNDFYDSEIKRSNSDENYIKVVKILFGKNNLGLPLKRVLSMTDQLTFEQGLKVWYVKEKYNVDLGTIFIKMENWGKLKQNTTVYGTWQTFVKGNYPQIIEWKC